MSKPHLRLGVRRAASIARLAAALALVWTLAAALPTAAGALTLPPGFEQTTAIGGLNEPTDVEVAPGGRVFIAEKSGLIRTYDTLSDPTPHTFADLRTQVHNYWDRGLMSIAVDPNFPTDPYIYVFYVYDALPGGTAPKWGLPGQTTDGCPDPPAGPGGTGDGCVVTGRVSRLQIAGEVMTGTESVLVSDYCFQYPSHSGGGLEFGADGNLYVSGGEGAAWHFADIGQDGSPVNPCGDPPGGVGGIMEPPTAEGGRLRSQDIRTPADDTTLDGALLRIDPDSGAGVPGNPFFSSTDADARRIVAYGLRNAFRMAIRPGSNDVYMGDPGGLGTAGFEEVDRVPDPTATPARNFGWPCYEGGLDSNDNLVNKKYPAFDQMDLDLCENLYTEGTATPPFWTYRHADFVTPGENCPHTSHAVSGLAFAPASGTFPSAYGGAFFVADYARDCIWVMRAGAGGVPDSSTLQNFAQVSPTPVDLEFGPNGDLYYVDIADSEIRRITFTGSPTNNPPTALAGATSPTSGTVPLTVDFDGTGSSDPDAGDVLSYQWDLDGDGQTDDSTSAQPSFTYSTAGVYTVTLKVTDTSGGFDTDTITVNAGSGPPSATITAPLATDTWRVGQTINFAGVGSDPDDGTIDPSTLDWKLILHHCSAPGECHEHGIQDFDNTGSGSFVAPDHEYPSEIELRLTATDSDGNTATDSVTISPQTVNLTIQSSPAAMDVVVGDVTGSAPLTKEVIVNSVNSVDAPSPQTKAGVTYNFSGWSDGQQRSHLITAPATSTTYTARYAAITAGEQTLTFSPEADAYVEEANPATNFGSATFLRTDAGGNPDTDSYLRFRVAGLPGRVTNAKLRLFSTSNTIDGPAAYPTSNSWTESGITWGNKPAPTGGPLSDTTGIATGTWVEWDVTPAVTGIAQFSFQMHQTVSDGVNFNSRESTSTTRRPELVLTVSNDAYPRPKGAGPFRVPFVPAYEPCTSPNRTHGPPLEHPSCNPPSQASHNITVGTPDANNRAANSVGYLRYVVTPGDTGTTADEADVPFEFKLSDVRVTSTLFDYSGELQARASIRMTDRRNGTAGNESGTVQDLTLPATIPCAVTPDPDVGADCNLTTSLDALTPGLVRESARTLWQLSQVDVLDGGTDGDVDTPPNQVFARQGIFVP
jgi:glucose/arabinose dehydrogenase/PKD repeat protein